MRSQRFIAFFLVLITVLSTTAFNFPWVGISPRIVDHHAVDSTAMDSSDIQGEEAPDSTNVQTPISESDSLLLNLDSLKARFDREHGIEPNKSKAIQWNDSVAAAEDSIRKTQKKSALDAPVVYTAKDSMTFFMGTKTAYLYGNADVKYQNINLTSENIHMNMDSSTVYATYGLDSIGNMYGKPVFKEGSDEYKTETMSYNFKTKKGFITNIYTEQEDGFLTSEQSKKDSEGVYYLRGGTYTTCDEEHPHFYIRMSRAKVRPGKNVFSGPAWLVVEDVPLPLAVPFAYFPITSTYSSGFIMPTYGDEFTRGFYLRDGGYYFAISDYMDLKVTGEIFTKGSWGIGTQTTYKKRYKYAGNFYFNYQVTKDGEKNMPDYSVAKNFKVQWSHRTDPKASPNSSFSASVNFATQSYEKNNLSSLYNPTSYSQSTRTSSVSYSHNFRKIGLSLSSSMNISQNMRDSTIALTLPSMSWSLSTFYPFKRKVVVGKERWYEKISLKYTGTLSNSITTKEDKLLKSSLVKDWKNGMKHNIPVSASFNILKYINITPMLNYTERWYTNKVIQSYDEGSNKVVRDTIYGFNRVFDYNLSLTANTKLYGFYKPNPKVFGSKLNMVRHVFTPSVSFSYAPDFGDSRYGYWKTYTRTDEDGNVTQVPYSPYTGSLYGTPSIGKTGAVSFSISNNVEAKIVGKNDSLKKVSIIDELGASLSYNMAAERQPWSNLSTRLRLKWGKATFNMSAVFMTYAYEFDKNGNVIVGDRTEWSYGRWGRFQGMSKNLSYTFNNQTLRKWKEGVMKLFGRGKDLEDEAEDAKNEDDEDEESVDDLETNIDGTGKRGKKKKDDSPDGLDADGYMKFQMPWSFTVSYGLTMYEDRSKDINVKTMRYPYSFTQNLNFSGNLKLASNWNCNFASGWDFTTKKISMTTVNISRDMHCFNISCGLVFGIYTSYHISLRANASTLTDALKYDKKSSYSSSIQWY
ncbi:MAG: LPS-assembly protein LptD [Bacteroidaceae bacterium]|nr:LPS-assembly protein LptD [Bacteroidaceae bacterium]